MVISGQSFQELYALIYNQRRGVIYSVVVFDQPGHLLVIPALTIPFGVPLIVNSPGDLRWSHTIFVIQAIDQADDRLLPWHLNEDSHRLPATLYVLPLVAIRGGGRSPSRSDAYAAAPLWSSWLYGGAHFHPQGTLSQTS